ncbi:MAG: FAD-dependent oxidoreductase [Chloroflexota bacterium]
MSHINVIGAGIFGVTAARELNRRGHQVALFDPGPLPHPLAASTDISKAIRMDYGGDELYMALMEEALRGWDAWNAAWGEPLYHEDGILFLSRRPLQPGGFEYESFTLLQQRGHRPQRLNSATLKARFPAWAAERYPDGYFNPRGGWAESGRVVARLLEQAQAEGVELRQRVAFAQLLQQRGRVAGFVAADGTRYLSDSLVVAAGAWTPTLLPHLSEVMWAVGQPVLHFRPDDPAAYRPPHFPVWGADIANTGWYGFPATAEGIVKVANHGPGRRVDPDEPRLVATEEEERFRAFLRETFPGLAGAPLVGRRLCLYCDTWDGNFWIDHDPEREGLWVAAGGSGHGFKFAPVIGPLVADVLEGKANPYAGRFAWRARQQLTTEDARYS